MSFAGQSLNYEIVLISVHKLWKIWILPQTDRSQNSQTLKSHGVTESFSAHKKRLLNYRWNTKSTNNESTQRRDQDGHIMEKNKNI